MVTDAASWWPAWETFLFSLIGAFVGGSLFAWLSGYYSEKGKRKLITEELPKVLEQARRTAYEEQRGKNLATHEDIQQVVEQVRAVTRETELIKAQIGSDVWTHQWTLDRRKESYVALTSALIGYANASQVIIDLANSETYPLDQMQNGIATVNTAAVEVYRAQAFAEMFCGEHVYGAMLELQTAFAKHSELYSEALRNETELPLFDVTRPLTELTIAARLDFGLQPTRVLPKA